MHKLVIVINGSGGVGKDSICNIVGKHYSTMNISSVDPIKKIAFENGWDGGKNEKSRKFLADLKQLFVDFNDLPCKYLLGKYQEFLESNNEILFVHIREPEEISKFKKSIQEACITLLIRRNSHTKKEWNNSADDNVENFDYDFYYNNIKPLNELEKDFMKLFHIMIEKNNNG